MDPKSCTQAELLLAWLDGALPEAERDQAADLWQRDPAVRPFVEELHALSAEVRRLPVHRLPCDLTDHVFRQAKQRRSERGPDVSTCDSGRAKASTDVVANAEAYPVPTSCDPGPSDLLLTLPLTNRPSVDLEAGARRVLAWFCALAATALICVLLFDHWPGTFPHRSYQRTAAQFGNAIPGPAESLSRPATVTREEEAVLQDSMTRQLASVQTMPAAQDETALPRTIAAPPASEISAAPELSAAPTASTAFDAPSQSVAPHKSVAPQQVEGLAAGAGALSTPRNPVRKQFREPPPGAAERLDLLDLQTAAPPSPPTALRDPFRSGAEGKDAGPRPGAQPVEIAPPEPRARPKEFGKGNQVAAIQAADALTERGSTAWDTESVPQEIVELAVPWQAMQSGAFEQCLARYAIEWSGDEAPVAAASAGRPTDRKAQPVLPGREGILIESTPSNVDAILADLKSAPEFRGIQVLRPVTAEQEGLVKTSPAARFGRAWALSLAPDFADRIRQASAKSNPTDSRILLQENAMSEIAPDRRPGFARPGFVTNGAGAASAGGSLALEATLPLPATALQVPGTVPPVPEKSQRASQRSDAGPVAARRRVLFLLRVLPPDAVVPRAPE